MCNIHTKVILYDFIPASSDIIIVSSGWMIWDIVIIVMNLELKNLKHI